MNFAFDNRKGFWTKNRSKIFMFSLVIIVLLTCIPNRKNVNELKDVRNVLHFFSFALIYGVFDHQYHKIKCLRIIVGLRRNLHRLMDFSDQNYFYLRWVWVPRSLGINPYIFIPLQCLRLGAKSKYCCPYQMFMMSQLRYG